MITANTLIIKLFASGVRLEHYLIGKAERVLHFQNWLLANIFTIGAKQVIAKREMSNLHDVLRLPVQPTNTPRSSQRETCVGERGDVPGWVLVVLMTAGLVTGIWTVAAPRLNQILRTSLDSMNSIR